MQKRKLHIAEFEDLNDSAHEHKRRRRIIYAATLLFSLLFIFAGNRLLSNRLPNFSESHPALYRATVTEILSQDVRQSEQIFEDGSQKGIEHFTTIFAATLKEGARKGESVEVIQDILSLEVNVAPTNLVQVGDTIYIAAATPGAAAAWSVYGFERSSSILILFLVFAFLLIAFGLFKGLNTLLSLLLTCGAVFFVLIPAVLSGHNAYLWTTIVCIFIIVMSLLVINGFNEKTLAAGSASIMGMSVASLLMLIMNASLKLTGFVNEEASYLSRINPGISYDIKAIMFCAIMLGATGAVMDVSMDIASSLHELSLTEAGKSLPLLIKSGFAIGKDSIGTMANTLILAYVGGSFISLLLLVALNLNNLRFLLNSEGMIVELLQMLIGAFSMLFTIPFATLICALLYTRNHRRNSLNA